MVFPRKSSFLIIFFNSLVWISWLLTLSSSFSIVVFSFDLLVHFWTVWSSRLSTSTSPSLSFYLLSSLNTLTSSLYRSVQSSSVMSSRRIISSSFVVLSSLKYLQDLPTRILSSMAFWTLYARFFWGRLALSISLSYLTRGMSYSGLVNITWYILKTSAWMRSISSEYLLRKFSKVSSASPKSRSKI